MENTIIVRHITKLADGTEPKKTVNQSTQNKVANEQSWTSKKDAMAYFHITKIGLDRVIDHILSSNIDVTTQNHIKKGGYHNSEVFYDDYLMQQIEMQLKANQLNQGVQTAAKNEVKSDYYYQVILADKQLAVEKEITKQMRIVAKHESLLEDYKKMRAEAISELQIRNAENVVYLLGDRSKTAFYKVGQSANPMNRLKVGQAMNPDIYYIAHIDLPTKTDALNKEKEIHEYLKEYNLKNYESTTATEWFILTKEKLEEIIKLFGFSTTK